MKLWTPVHVWGWLTAWHVERGVTDALMKAGVDGWGLQDLVYGALGKDPAPWEAVGVTSEEAKRAVVAACQYPLSCGWVVSRWVRLCPCSGRVVQVVGLVVVLTAIGSWPRLVGNVVSNRPSRGCEML